MNARPEVKRILIAKRMKKWLTVARCYPNRDQSQARRNFLRLVARYPDIAAELGFSIISAYA